MRELKGFLSSLGVEGMSELGLLVDSLELLEKFITDVMEAEKIVIFGASGGGKRAWRFSRN